MAMEQIENEIFGQRGFDRERMREYGFVDAPGGYRFTADLMNGEFRAEITVSDSDDVSGIVIDKMNNETYAQLRGAAFHGSYVSSVRAAYEELLADIAEHCCTGISLGAGQDSWTKKHVDFIRKVLTIADNIPYGQVATYGQIARMAGRESNARLVGKIMSLADRYGEHPCHRVVNHAGRTVPGWQEQRAMLEAEGVTFRGNGCVDMKKHKIDID